MTASKSWGSSTAGGDGRPDCKRANCPCLDVVLIRPRGQLLNLRRLGLLSGHAFPCCGRGTVVLSPFVLNNPRVRLASDRVRRCLAGTELGSLSAKKNAMSGALTGSGSRSRQTPESDAVKVPSRQRLTKFFISTTRFNTILPCSCPVGMASQSSPRISSPRTPSLYRRRRSPAVSGFACAAVVVVMPDLSGWSRLLESHSNR